MTEIDVACVQIGPVYLDSSATTDKIVRHIEKASRKEPGLIIFPELVLSGYPNFSIASPEYRLSYIAGAVRADGPELAKISKNAEEYGAVVVLGFIERDPDFPEVIYDSSCVIDSDGALVGTHRKIAPFGAETLMFKKGDARDIRPFETGVGRLGIGLCFENLNPLYRRALTLLGEEIHCSLWVTSRDAKHVVESSAVVTAVEGGVYVALASQVQEGKGMLDRGLSFIGGSSILDPWGNYIAKPVYGRDKILHARMEPGSWHTRKFQSRGVESRDDLLSLNVVTEAYSPIHKIHPEKPDLSDDSREERETDNTH